MKFEKWQGTGNDFILVDARAKNFKKISLGLVKMLCDRKFGIGSDGLILIKNHSELDFEMVFFNPDGSQSFCGNGSRCAVAFAKKIGVFSTPTCQFQAIDGSHESNSDLPVGESNWVEIKMRDLENVQADAPDTFVLNTGSPHFIQFLPTLEGVDIVAEGKKVRYSPRFSEKGINVNLAHCLENQQVEMLTYERGVENETLSCGTGVTATAIASQIFQQKKMGRQEIAVRTRGGDLKVRFDARADGSFSDVWLCGAATFVFSGKI